jgi:hypothetical protein
MAGGREKRRREERGERKEERGERKYRENCWGDRSGPNRQESYTVLPGAICRYVHLWQLGPHLFSIFCYFYFFSFPSHLAQIEIPLLPLPLSSGNGCSPSLSLFPSTPSDAFAFAASPRSTYIGALLSHSFPFCHMNPSCMRLFPHVVLIIYTFSISRLFFSQLFRSVRRGFHLTPLSTYMRGDAPGISPNASLIPYPFRA